MPVSDLELVLDRVGYHSGGVDLHGFGEPLLDGFLVTKVTRVKDRWPDSRPRIYSTLGVKLGDGYLHGLISAGLRDIEVSFYGARPTSYNDVHGVSKFEVARANLMALCDLKREFSDLKVVIRCFPTHETVKPAEPEEEIEAFHLWLEGLGITLLRERDLHNYGDGRLYNIPTTNGICSVTWGLRKRILQVTWALDVIPCCFDFNASVVFGNLRDQTLAEIFNGPSYKEFIAAHLSNTLGGIPVCSNCERCFKS